MPLLIGCARRSKAASRCPVAPVDPKECRKNALQCTELAEQAKDPKHATILKNLAEQWLKAAIELERAEALWDELSSVLRKR